MLNNRFSLILFSLLISVTISAQIPPPPPIVDSKQETETPKKKKKKKKVLEESETKSEENKESKSEPSPNKEPETEKKEESQPEKTGDKEDTGNQVDSSLIHWAPVEGVKTYKIEVKNEKGEMVVDKETEETFFDPKELSPGTYTHRIGSINKFGKAVGFSEWKELVILKTAFPEIEIDEVQTSVRSVLEKSFTFKGKNLMEPTKVKIVSEKSGGVIEIVERAVISDSEMTLKIRFGDSPTGLYDIVLENPRQKVLFRKAFFLLTDDVKKAEKMAVKMKDPSFREMLNKDGSYVPPIWSVLWRSVVFPGWGQGYRDEGLKSFILPVLFIGSAGYFGKSYSDFKMAKEDYNSASKLTYISLPSTEWRYYMIHQYMESQSNFEKAQKNLNNAKIAVGVVAIVYIYNIIDVFLFHPKNTSQNDKLQPKEGFSFQFYTQTSKFTGSEYSLGLSYSF